MIPAASGRAIGSGRPRTARGRSTRCRGSGAGIVPRMDLPLLAVLLGVLGLGLLLIAVAWLRQIADDIEGVSDDPWRFRR
jgi:hypothetical protein